jgi:hypothetical protein
MNTTTPTNGEPTANTTTEATIIYEEYVEFDISYFQRTLNSYGTETIATRLDRAIKYLGAHALNESMAAFEITPITDLLYDLRDSVLIGGGHVNLTRQ